MALNYFIIFAGALLIALLATFTTRKLAIKLGVGELPDPRKVHKGFMPHMGGLGIYTGFVGGIVLAAFLLPGPFTAILKQFSGLLLASIVIVALGAYDDLKGLSAAKKFAGQFLAVSLIIWLDFRIERISVPFGTPLELGLLSIPITYFWLIGVSNAVNLLDGLDGLAGGVSVVAAAVFAIVAAQNNDPALILISISLIAGLLGFLKYNYHPASIFMGDTGSLFLGLMLAALAMKTFEASPGQVSLIIPVIVLAIPIGDTSIAFFRRLNKGHHPFKPDKDHLHHRLIYLGLSHRQAVHIIYLISFLYGITAYLIVTKSAFFGLLLLIFVIVLSIFGLRRIGYLEAQKFKTFYGDESIIRVKQEIAPLSMSRLWHKLIIGFSDVVMINMALFLTWWLRYESGWLPVSRQIVVDELLITPVTFLLTVGWLALFVLNNLYSMRWDVSRFDQVQRISKVLLFGIVALFVITMNPEDLFSEGRISLIIYGLLLLILINLGRLLIIWVEKKLALLEYATHKTLLVGATEKGRKLLKDITQNPHLLYEPVGYVAKEHSGKSFYGLDCLGTYEDIPRIIREQGIEEIIIAINERSRDEILNIVAPAESFPVVFKLLPQIYDVVSGHKTEEVIGHPLIRLFPDRMYLWQWGLKRLFDIVVSLLMMVALSPLALLIVILQLIDGIYPVMIIENMVGKNGKLYGLLNFETSARNKKKKSWVGHFLFVTRLYKFPALINILLGKMSFVGPRPEAERNVRVLREKIKFYNRRFQVRPGLSGWAQVKYRYEEALKHRRDQLKQDLFYLENISLAFDMRILLRSIIIFFVRNELDSRK